MNSELTTEATNAASEGLDCMTTLEMVRLINDEDAKIAAAVRKAEQSIASAIDLIADRLSLGGRLIYAGAGTSGRLGVLDASECPPTFNVDPSMVIGLIAGGNDALVRAVEGAEDSKRLARDDLHNIKVSDADVVVGIAASGGTPYVIESLDVAAEVGAATVAITCNKGAPVIDHADIGIAVVVGPEVLAGSTRLKAGTATKMVLNMLTTGSMVRLGKTYGNLMVDLQATNEKLKRRSVGLVTKITGLSSADAEALLVECGGDLKTAVVSHQAGVTKDEAERRLENVDGRLRKALEENV